MIKITFPDQSVREFESGVTGIDIAKSISNSLARDVVAVSVNGEVWDATRPIQQDAALVLHKFETPEGKHAFWHSSAHLMAEALEALYPGIKFGIGPAIENGFYYDVDPGDGVVIAEADLTRIEEKMAELGRKNSEYRRVDISKGDVTSLFREKGDEYKLELINDLARFHHRIQAWKLYRPVPWAPPSRYRIHQGHQASERCRCLLEGR